MKNFFNYIKEKIKNYKNKNEEVTKIKKTLKQIKTKNVVDIYKDIVDLQKTIEKSFNTLKYKKVVINISHYGFGLSEEALKNISDLKNKEISIETQFELSREDHHLIEVIEKMGLESNDGYSKLAVVKIPEGIEYEIKNINGNEKIYIYGEDYTNKLLK